MNSNIIRGPWVQRPDPPRMSMSDLRSHVHYHLSTITAFEEILREIASTFVHSNRGFPFAYSDYVAKTLTPFRKSLKDLCRLLDETSQLPLALTALSYNFFPPLLFLDSQAKSLTTLVEELCLASRLRPYETGLLSQRARLISETLIERVTMLPTTIDVLLDQASFYEVQLTAITQRFPTSTSSFKPPSSRVLSIENTYKTSEEQGDSVSPI